MTAMTPKRKRRGWFEESSNILQPLINQKYTALAKMKSVPDAIKPLWKEKISECNKQVKEAVEVAKAKWVASRAEKLNQMNADPKEGWRMAREIKAGVTGHHTKPITMKMRMKDGRLANNDKQNMEVMATYFTEVYNTHRNFRSDAAKLIKK